MAGSGLKLQFSADRIDLDSSQELFDTPSSRPTRIRTKPKKYGDFLETSPVKKVQRDIFGFDDGNDEYANESSHQKPTALFSNDDVEGQHIFRFKSRHTRYDLQNKVKAAINSSPKMMEGSVKKPRGFDKYTSVNSALYKESQPTPKQVKDIIKKRITREVDSDSADSDFSDSSSDFVPDQSDDETESSSSARSSEEREQPKMIGKLVKDKEQRTKGKDSEYFVTPDNYFMMHSSKKIATSDHTLARLKNLNIHENDTEDIKLSDEHSDRVCALGQRHRQLFNRWLYVLSENFNIVLYGVGSKREVLQEFQKQKLRDFPCVVVNGFFPSLTLKSILETIVVDLLENSHMPNNIGDIVNLIDAQLTENNVHLFLIIHNIDGSTLRNTKAQATLAGISQIERVHTLATIDHINAPLLWDHVKLSKFRFTWWDATTLEPYAEETSFESSLMTQRSGALQLSSLRSVHQSLTTNAKGIFKIILEHQLENQKQTHWQGLPFRDLYSKCREQFLVSSELALRAQLTEFLDHKLVKMKRTYDGGENLSVPIDNTLLQQFLDENNS